ncbi:MAG: hypothetical protein C0594_10660 [Marinilabiliales bacterium]|mgnify:CR=1 FL=1|nr:MAG: hypothetical protein C0594_10660 [Marinilabiliales bacterium]
MCLHIAKGQAYFNVIIEDTLVNVIEGIEQVDDGYILNGYTINNGDYIIVNKKVDLEGNLIWRKTIERPGFNLYGGRERSFFKLAQGGFALAGSINTDTTFDKTMLFVFNENMDTLYTKIYNIPDYMNFAFGGIQTNDGGFALTGTGRNLTDFNIIDCLLLKTDSLGELLWYNTYGGTGSDNSLYVVQSTENGFILGAYTLSFNNTTWPGDQYIIKTDSLGNEQWGNNYGNVSYDDGAVMDLIRTSDNNYIYVASKNYYHAISDDYSDERGRIIKFNNQGQTIWDKIYREYNDFYEPHDSSTSNFYGIEEGDDGKLAVLCGVTKLDNSFYSKLYILNSEGDSLYTLELVPPDGYNYVANEVNIIRKTSDGGFIIGGKIYNFLQFPPEKTWLIKTDCNGFYGSPEANFSYSKDSLTITLTNHSVFADSCIWDFGDGYQELAGIHQTITHTYADSGYYSVQLISYSSCNADITDEKVEIIGVLLSGVDNSVQEDEIKIYPVPANDFIVVEFNPSNRIEIMDMQGKLLCNLVSEKSAEMIDISEFRSGSYVVNIYHDERLLFSRNIIVQK